MKKFILIALLSVFPFSFTYGTKVVQMENLINPTSISADTGQLYITDGIRVLIYTKNDYSLIKIFGKEGEGPKEFKLLQPGGFPLLIDVQTEEIIINSLNKISFFSKGGVYKREKKASVGAFSGAYQPLGRGFAGIGFSQEDKTLYRSIHITDEKINKLKDVFRIEHDFQQGKGFKAIQNPFAFQTYQNKLFIGWETNFIIYVFDEKGTKLYSINQNYIRIPVSKEHKRKIIEFYKTNPNTKQIFEFLKDQMYFPKLFPAIRSMIIVDQKIYLQTYKQKVNLAEFYIFDLDGNLRKKKLLPVMEQNPITVYPYTIREGKIYQLIENTDEEGWELHISDIK